MQLVTFWFDFTSKLLVCIVAVYFCFRSCNDSRSQSYKENIHCTFIFDNKTIKTYIWLSKNTYNSLVNIWNIKLNASYCFNAYLLWCCQLLLDPIFYSWQWWRSSSHIVQLDFRVHDIWVHNIDCCFASETLKFHT